METGKRHIKSGIEFEKYIERPTGINESIKSHSNLEDTVRFLPKAIGLSYKQALRIAPLLKRNTLYETCKEIWNWAYTHIQYEKDDTGKEQIRSFRRSFYDRVRGIDCDDYTVLISSILCCLKIKHILRVAKYSDRNGFQHIYPIVPNGKGNYITVDCVVDSFNYEVPFIEKIDTAMDLEFLDGIDDVNEAYTKLGNIDAEDLMKGFDDFGDLGGRKFKDTKIGKGLKKGFHAINRVNPAAVLLRTGILASLKLNVFKVAEKLRYAYLDTNTASQKKLDLSKFNRLVAVKDKLEKIFYGAGGNADNFKKAILTGRGNRDREVLLAGLGMVNYDTYSEQSPLSQILGVDSYTTEVSGIEGLGALGEPATAAAIASATGVMAAIAGLLKSIGSLKKGGKSQDESGDTTADSLPTRETTSISNETSEPELKTTTTATTTSNNSQDADTNGGGNKSSSTETPANDEKTASTTNDTTTTDTNASKEVAVTNAKEVAKDTKPSAMDNVKTWVTNNKLATGAIVLTTVGLAIWGISSLVKKNKGKAGEKNKSQNNGVSGTPKKTGKSKHSKHKYKPAYSSKITYQKLK